MAVIHIDPALAAALPTGAAAHWVGTDSTTPDGYFGVIGTDWLANITFWLIEGTPEAPGAMIGRVVSDHRASKHVAAMVYGGRNRYLGRTNGGAADSDLLVQDHIRAV